MGSKRLFDKYLIPPPANPSMNSRPAAAIPYALLSTPPLTLSHTVSFKIKRPEICSLASFAFPMPYDFASPARLYLRRLQVHTDQAQVAGYIVPMSLPKAYLAGGQGAPVAPLASCPPKGGEPYRCCLRKHKNVLDNMPKIIHNGVTLEPFRRILCLH